MEERALVFRRLLQHLVPYLLLIYAVLALLIICTWIYLVHLASPKLTLAAFTFAVGIVEIMALTVTGFIVLAVIVETLHFRDADQTAANSEDREKEQG